MFAIVRIAGKQFKAEIGKNLKIDTKFETKEKKIKFSDILLVSNEKNLAIGKPLLKGTTVEAEIIESSKSKKVIVAKHHSKKHYRRTSGHRQDQTVIKVTKINEKK